jgi:hypothetical protein
MELPAPLTSWSEWLAWFSPELAPELGELVHHLHPLIGQFRGNRAVGEPLPDGLGDLHRRGPYERLLSSEWLFAEELPDEFLRRAASGEHLFLAPRPPAQQAQKQIIALFDAGPLQLGGPRLVQLAVWILLARRAREAGGALRWGTVQATPFLHASDKASHLQQLLKARTFTLATGDHLTVWRDWLADSGVAAGEIWLIGDDLPASVAGACGCTHQVASKPNLEGDALDVAVKQGLSVRRISLPLPTGKPVIHLLKGQFQADATARTSLHRPSPHSLAIVRPPLLSWQGNRVAVTLLEEHGAMVFPVPRQGTEHPGKPRRQRWSAGARPLTLVFSGKTLGAVLDANTDLSFWQLPQLPSITRPSREVFEAPPGRANFLPAVWLRSRTVERLYVLDRAGRLVYWQTRGPRAPGTASATTIHNLDNDVLNLAQVADNSFVYVRREREQLCVHRVNHDGKSAWRCPLAAAPGDAKILFGGASLWRGGIGGCAVRLQAKPAECWRCYTPAQNSGQAFEIADITPEVGWRGIGFVLDPETASFGLLTLDRRRHTLALHSGRRETLYTTSAAIAKFTVSPVSGVIAMLTEERELIIYSVPERHVRLIVNGRGIEHATR